MDFVRRFASCTPQSASVVAGLACALIMMEVQRMPVAHSVSFSMFAPVPYLAEAFALMVLAFLIWRYPARRLSNSAILRGAVGFLATLSTWLVLWGTGLDETLMFVVRAVYRASTGLLVVLWAERLMGLGSWREGCLIAAAIIVSGALTCLLSVVPANVLEGILVLLPLVAAGAFLTYRGRPGDGGSSALPSISPAEHHPLPAFSLETTRDIVAAAGLLAFPLLCRSPMISTQSAWMPLQDGFTMDQAMQLSIGAGTILGGVAVALIIRFAWNRSFVLVLDLLVLPLSLVSLYTAQLVGMLFVLHFLIVDSTYKVVLFYIMMVPFLFPEMRKGPRSVVPLYASFAFMIAMRALFSGLHSLLPESLYATLVAVVVLLSFTGAALLALLLVHRQMTRREPSPEATPSQVSGASETSPLGQRPDIVAACSALGDRFELTPREREIFLLLAQNYRAPYIAEKLVVSQSTVKTHMRNLYAKLGVHSQAELLLLVDEEAAK